MQGIHTAIVDEADNILIDEAVTPLIISQKRPNPQFEEACRSAHSLSVALKEGKDYKVDYEYKEIEFIRDMDDLLSEYGRTDNIYLRASGFGQELLRQAINAEEFLRGMNNM